MNQPPPQYLIWRTSSYSGPNANCVETALHPTGAALRDTKHRDAGHLAFPVREWAAFLHTLRARRL